MAGRQGEKLLLECIRQEFYKYHSGRDRKLDHRFPYLQKKVQALTSFFIFFFCLETN